MSTAKKFPRIRDFRVYPEGQRRKDTAEEGLLQVIGYRFICKLKEMDYGIGPYHHVYFYVTLADGLPEFELHDWMPDPDVGWNRSFKVTFPPAFPQFNEIELHDYLAGFIRDALVALANDKGADTEPINQVFEHVCKHRENLEFTLKVKETKKYRVQIYYKFRRWYHQTHARVTELATGRQGDWVFAEVSRDEMFTLVGKIAIKDQVLVISPLDSTRAQWTIEHYVERGFEVPIQISLEDIFARSGG